MRENVCARVCACIRLNILSPLIHNNLGLMDKLHFHANQPLSFLQFSESDVVQLNAKERVPTPRQEATSGSSAATEAPLYSSNFPQLCIKQR